MYCMNTRLVAGHIITVCSPLWLYSVHVQVVGAPSKHLFGVILTHSSMPLYVGHKVIYGAVVDALLICAAKALLHSP